MKETTQLQLNRLKALLPDYKFYQQTHKRYHAGLFQKCVRVDNKKALFISIDVFNLNDEFPQADDLVSLEAEVNLQPASPSRWPKQVCLKLHLPMTINNAELLHEITELENDAVNMFHEMRCKFEDD